MSVYSGFATRKDETNYNQLLAKLLRTLISHLLELTSPVTITKTKSLLYSKLIIKIQQYDQHKYLEPKFSQLLDPLAQLVGLPDKIEESLDQTRSKWGTNEQRIRTPSSGSQNQFRSRKVSQGGANVGLKQEQESAKRHEEKSWHVNHTPGRKAGEELAKTPKKDYKYLSFYASQQQKHDKIIRNHQNKLQELHGAKERGKGAKFNRFKTMPSGDQKLDESRRSGRMEHCLDLKAVKQAQSYLEECKRQDHFYRIAQNISFSQI